jgi:hypothetical protein
MGALTRIVTLAIVIGSVAGADDIAGTITDATTGAPIADATIAVMGAGLTTRSDSQGRYALTTNASSVRGDVGAPWRKNGFRWNRGEGEYIAEVRTLSGHLVERFDSRSAGRDRDFSLQLKTNSIHLVTIRTEKGMHSFRANGVLGGSDFPQEIRLSSSDRNAVAARSAALNPLKFTKYGYEVANHSFEGSGVLDIKLNKDPNLLANGHFLDSLEGWEVDRIAPADADIALVRDAPDSGSGKAMKISVTAIDSASPYGWQVQAYYPVGIVAGTEYTLSYWIKSDVRQAIPVVVMENHAPFGHHFEGADWMVTVTPTWTFHTETFTLDFSDPSMRINFGNMAQRVGQSFYLADVVLKSSAVQGIVPTKP